MTTTKTITTHQDQLKAWPMRVRLCFDSIATGHLDIGIATMPFALSEMCALQEDEAANFLLGVATRMSHLSYAAKLAPSIRAGHTSTPLRTLLTPTALQRLEEAKPPAGHPSELFLAPMRPDGERNDIIRRFLTRNPPDHVHAVLRTLVPDRSAFWVGLAQSDPDLLDSLCRSRNPSVLFEELLEAIAAEADQQARTPVLIKLIEAFASNTKHPGCHPKTVTAAAIVLRRLADPEPARLFFNKAIQPRARNLGAANIAKLIVRDAAAPFVSDLLSAAPSRIRWDTLDLLVRCEPGTVPDLLPAFAAAWSTEEVLRLHKIAPLLYADVVESICVIIQRTSLTASAAAAKTTTNRMM